MALDERLRGDTGRRRDRDENAKTVWRTVQAGLWVAEPDGEFAGFIEKRGRSDFEVIDHLGRTRGFFPSLEQAKAGLPRTLSQ